MKTISIYSVCDEVTEVITVTEEQLKMLDWVIENFTTELIYEEIKK